MYLIKKKEMQKDKISEKWKEICKIKAGLLKKVSIAETNLFWYFLFKIKLNKFYFIIILNIIIFIY